MVTLDIMNAHRRSLSDKARYNFDSDMRQWLVWRSRNDLLTAANPFEVRDFVLYCAITGFERGPFKSASISHLLSLIERLHVRIIEAHDPTKNINVKGEMKRLRRDLGTIQGRAVACNRGDSEQEVRVLSYGRNINPEAGAVARLRHMAPLR